jgi:hypothetical protein
MTSLLLRIVKPGLQKELGHCLVHLAKHLFSRATLLSDSEIHYFKHIRYVKTMGPLKGLARLTSKNKK